MSKTSSGGNRMKNVFWNPIPFIYISQNFIYNNFIVDTDDDAIALIWVYGWNFTVMSNYS